MHKIARFLSFAFIAQCTIYGTDAPVTFSQEEALKEVLHQKILQKYLVHSSAHSLIRVNKEFSKLMDEWNNKNRDKLWIDDPEIFPTGYSIMFVPVSDGKNIEKESILFDASCNKACGIHENTATKIPSLCYFSWPSRDPIKQKKLSVNPAYTHSTVQNFFWRGIGVAQWDDGKKVDIICYLPTGYMVHIPKEFSEHHEIKWSDEIRCSEGFQLGRTTVICKSYNSTDGYQTIFTTDSSAVIKAGDGQIIPWQKIE
jgi:hypothetical protein